MGTREREVLARGDMPRHVAVIMDGNGRWAKRRHRPRIFGHREGMKSVRRVIEAAADLEIPYLTLFAFSQENWKRPRAEVEALMTLLKRYIDSERDELVEKGIRVKAIGELDRLEPVAGDALDRLIEATAAGEALTVTLCLSYGGRTEIVEAARRAMKAARAGEMDPEDLDEETFAGLLYTADLPDPDLLIRTSGELRVSNFLLWQIAYTELYVTDILWPDFDRQALVEAIAAYQERERRFGTVHA
ncbi:MAG: isoprenyl transferase [Gemmatimonadetes bacterium]|nr:isoprenyl transferase [Gemmatimonadota bacterium]